MSVPENLRTTYNEKTFFAMKVERAVKPITFDRTEASPGETLSCFSALVEPERGSGAGLASASL